MGEGRVLEARPVALYHGGRQDGDDVTGELAKRRVQSQEKNVEISILGRKKNKFSHILFKLCKMVQFIQKVFFLISFKKEAVFFHINIGGGLGVSTLIGKFPHFFHLL